MPDCNALLCIMNNLEPSLGCTKGVVLFYPYTLWTTTLRTISVMFQRRRPGRFNRLSASRQGLRKKWESKGLERKRLMCCFTLFNIQCPLISDHRNRRATCRSFLLELSISSLQVIMPGEWVSTRCSNPLIIMYLMTVDPLRNRPRQWAQYWCDVAPLHIWSRIGRYQELGSSVHASLSYFHCKLFIPERVGKVIHKRGWGPPLRATFFCFFCSSFVLLAGGYLSGRW